MEKTFTPISEVIIEGCKRNDRRYQKQLYQHVSPFVYRQCLEEGLTSIEAQELLEELFVAVFTNINSLTPSVSFDDWFLHLYMLAVKKRHTRFVTVSFQQFGDRLFRTWKSISNFSLNFK